METMSFDLLERPWTLLLLLYTGAWFIAFICARPRTPPPTPDRSSPAPAAPGKARAEATE